MKRLAYKYSIVYNRDNLNGYSEIVFAIMYIINLELYTYNKNNNMKNTKQTMNATRDILNVFLNDWNDASLYKACKKHDIKDIKKIDFLLTKLNAEIMKG